MWIANIIRTERNKGDLDIIVTFSKDDQGFDVAYHLTTAQPNNWLDGQISAKLTQLNNLDIYEAAIEATNKIGKSFQLDPQNATLEIIP